MGLTVIKGSGGRVAWRDFSGGVVLNDALDIAEDQFLSGLNFTTAFESPGVQLRPGYVSLTSSMPDDGTGATPEILAVSPLSGNILVHKGTKLYIYSAFTNVWTTVAGVVTAGAGHCAADFPYFSAFVYANTSDGVYTLTWAGVLTLRDANVKACCMDVWQTKVFAGGGGSATPNRIWWSNALNPNTWTTATDFIDVLEGTSGIFCLKAAAGMDIQGRAGFLMGKQQGLFRMNSPTTGAYTTISVTVGAANQNCISTLDGYAYILSNQGAARRGVYRTTGLDEPQIVSRAIDTGFSREIGTISTAPNPYDWICAQRGRIYCSLPGFNQAIYTTYVGEFDPAGSGWFIHNLAHALRNVYSMGFATGSVADGLVAVRADANSNVVYALWDMTINYSGTDAGTALVGELRTGWRLLNGGRRAKPLRLFPRGRSINNAVSVGIHADYVTDTSTSFSIASAATPLLSSLPVGSKGPCKAALVYLTATGGAGTTGLLDQVSGKTYPKTPLAIDSLTLEYSNLGL